MPMSNTDELLAGILMGVQDLLILQLALAAVPQREIRKLLGVDIGRINRVAKLVKKRKHAEP